MSRIYMNLFDDWGCGHYRCAQPVNHCFADLARSGTSLFMYRDLHSEELNFDAYILHRIPAETFIFFAQKLQKDGKKFVIELDDDIFGIPPWMPSQEYQNSKWSLKKSLEIADEVWVSTGDLAKSLNFPAKTRVLPNLVDYNAFLNVPREPGPIKVLWMGSMWHEKDLEVVVDPVNRLIEEYGDAVQFIFWGCIPSDFCDFFREPGRNTAVMKQKEKYGTRLVFHEGIPFRLYFDRLCQLQPDIGLAPLVDCQFNRCKSNLKFLEYSMAGAATVATRLSPYDCVENDRDGLLVAPDDSQGWYDAIKRLIDDRMLRAALVKSAREKVFEEYSWQSQNKKNLWLNSFQNLVGR